MKLINFFALIILFSAATINAQETTLEQLGDSGTIENQFDYLINKSNRYQDYKVVKRTWLDKLRETVSDSLNTIRFELRDTKLLLSNKESKISKLSNDLDVSRKNVSTLENENNSIGFFGILLSKPLYNSILWSIIAILLLFLLIFIIRFNKSNKITKNSKEKFEDIEKEFEDYRQRSLEREQQLRRRLQDELNKQKNEK